MRTIRAGRNAGPAASRPPPTPAGDAIPAAASADIRIAANDKALAALLNQLPPTTNQHVALRVHRYRDLKLYVLFTGESGLSIIGEIQARSCGTECKYAEKG